MYINENIPSFHGLYDKSVKTDYYSKGLYLFNTAPIKSPTVFISSNRRTYPKMYMVFQRDVNNHNDLKTEVNYRAPIFFTTKSAETQCNPNMAALASQVNTDA